jgi:cell division protein FtsL
MLKLLLSLAAFAVIAGAMLHLREQKREFGFQINQLHAQIEARQASLWNQQLQIAIYTAPNAIARTVGVQDLKMAPPMTLPAPTGRWTDSPSSQR